MVACLVGGSVDARHSAKPDAPEKALNSDDQSHLRNLNSGPIGDNNFQQKLQCMRVLCLLIFYVVIP